MRVAGGFIPRLRSRKRVIPSLRGGGKFPLFPGHKCPGYPHPPRWGEERPMQSANRTMLNLFGSFADLLKEGRMGQP